jgi:2,4-dienoyl-CoA reductase-like NADH-dependent reductase (Old Yellow Enzyme family)
MAGLFDPLDIKGMRLKNRIVMPPMNMRMATSDGSITERHIKHYVERARGGVGLIIVEHAYVLPSGIFSPGQLGFYDDNLIAGYRHLTESVHQQGARIAIQLNHAGSRTKHDIINDQPAGPWNIPVPGDTEIPRPLSVSELEIIAKAFGEAARRAVDAGFDAVEIHGAHGYLLSQFLSPYTNKRQDEYGFDLEGRLRLPLEVIGEVKRRISRNIPLFYRFGADDMVEGGLTRDQAKLIAPRLVQAGVDVMDVSGGLGGPGNNLFSEQGYFVPLAQSIKETVKVPVIGVGNITQPEYADSIVREGKIDLVAFGRILLSNPDFPKFAAKKLGISKD